MTVDSLWIGPRTTRHDVQSNDWPESEDDDDVVETEQTFAWCAVVRVCNPLAYDADCDVHIDLLDADGQCVGTVGVWTLGSRKLHAPGERREHVLDGTERWTRPIVGGRVHVRYIKVTRTTFDVRDAVIDGKKIRCTLQLEHERAATVHADLKIYSASGALLQAASTTRTAPTTGFRMPAGASSLPLDLVIRPLTVAAGKVTCTLDTRMVMHEDPERVLEMVATRPSA